MENSIQQKPEKQLTKVEERMISVLRVSTSVAFFYVLYFTSPLRNPEFKLENFKWNNGDDLVALFVLFVLWMIYSAPWSISLFIMYRVMRRSIMKGK